MGKAITNTQFFQRLTNKMLASRIGITEKKLKKMYQKFYEFLIEELKLQGKVPLPYVGYFYSKEIPPKIYKVPLPDGTMTERIVPAKIKIKFKVSKIISDELNKSVPEGYGEEELKEQIVENSIGDFLDNIVEKE